MTFEKISVLAVTLSALVAASSSFAAAEAEEKHIEKIMPAVVAIYGPPLGGICTGSVVSHNLVITAGHCVSALKEYVVVKKDTTKSIEAKVVFLSHAFDLAILELEHSVSDPYLAIVGPNESLKAGEKLTVIGHRWGKINDIRKGKFKEISQNILKFEADARPGNSGGPVLNEKGHIVGILYGISVSGDTYAVSAEEIRKALNSLETSTTELRPWSPSYKHLGYRFVKNNDNNEHYFVIGIENFYESLFMTSVDVDIGIFPQLSGSVGIPLRPYLRIDKPPYFLGTHLIPQIEVFYDTRDGRFAHRYAVGFDFLQAYVEFGFAKRYQGISIQLRSPL